MSAASATKKELRETTLQFAREYGPGHPWYYLGGGPILLLHEIQAAPGPGRPGHWYQDLLNHLEIVSAHADKQRRFLKSALKRASTELRGHEVSYWRGGPAALEVQAKARRRDIIFHHPGAETQWADSIATLHNQVAQARALIKEIRNAYQAALPAGAQMEFFHD